MENIKWTPAAKENEFVNEMWELFDDGEGKTKDTYNISFEALDCFFRKIFREYASQFHLSMDSDIESWILERSNNLSKIPYKIGSDNLDVGPIYVDAWKDGAKETIKHLRSKHQKELEEKDREIERLKEMLFDIDKSLYIGEDLMEEDILKWYLDIVQTIKEEIQTLKSKEQ